MQPFEFHQAGSVSDAIDAVKRGDEGKFIAGGQSLLPIMKLELAAPTNLVSLRGIAELRGVRVEGGALVIGAATTHREVAASDEIARALPALASLASHIGDAQVRNRGTLGGSVAHADPAADYPAALLALDAQVVTDRREIAAADFFQGPYETALETDELITAVRFPLPDAAAYAKFPQPASRFALVGVFVARTSGGARVAVAGARTQPFRIAQLESALDSRFDAAALNGVEVPADGLTDNVDASAEYRAHLIGVMARRAVEACAG